MTFIEYTQKWLKHYNLYDIVVDNYEASLFTTTYGLGHDLVSSFSWIIYANTLPNESNWDTWRSVYRQINIDFRDNKQFEIELRNN